MCFPYRSQESLNFINLFFPLSKLRFQLFVFFLQFFHSLAYPFAHNALFDVLSFRLFLYFGHVPSLCQHQLALFDPTPPADLKHTQFSTSFNLKSWVSLNLHNVAEPVLPQNALFFDLGVSNSFVDSFQTHHIVDLGTLDVTGLIGFAIDDPVHKIQEGDAELVLVSA